jgi:hypothetical protein
MLSEEKDAIEEEIINLKKILDFYVVLGVTMSSLSEEELTAHIDSILDRLNELKCLLTNEN